MKKLLLTGFEPFLQFKTNPTMDIVTALNGKVIDGFEVVGKTFVVDFQQSALQFKEAIEEVQPDIILSLGLAGGRSKITPERIAINVKDGAADNNGYIPIDEPIYPGEADGYFSTLPIREMTNALKAAGIPSSISNTAGAYLCNNIMYEGLRYAKSQQSIMSGFVHIPANFEIAIVEGKVPGWHQRDLLEGITIVIDECIKAYKKEDSLI